MRNNIPYIISLNNLNIVSKKKKKTYYKFHSHQFHIIEKFGYWSTVFSKTVYDKKFNTTYRKNFLHLKVNQKNKRIGFYLGFDYFT